MIAKLPLLLILASSLTSCASTTEPAPEPVVLKSACEPYDISPWGVKITCIYYDQVDNLAKVGVNDEWIDLQTLGATDTINTEGWMLNAGDSLQNYELPASIIGALRIFTKRIPDALQGPSMALGLGSWIWNNTTPDTARIINAEGQLVDIFTYRGR